MVVFSLPENLSEIKLLRTVAVYEQMKLSFYQNNFCTIYVVYSDWCWLSTILGKSLWCPESSTLKLHWFPNKAHSGNL